MNFGEALVKISEVQLNKSETKKERGIFSRSGSAMKPLAKSLLSFGAGAGLSAGGMILLDKALEAHRGHGIPLKKVLWLAPLIGAAYPIANKLMEESRQREMSKAFRRD